MEVVSLESTNKCADSVNGQSSNEDYRLTDNNNNNNNNNHDCWSIRDQLMLISFAIVNGDSNWSYVCDQMNKYSNFDGFKKKTSAQCAKKYRQIIKDFLNKSEQSDNKNQLIDLKKIYNELASERLDQVNCSINDLKDKYGQVCTQINKLIDLETNELGEVPLSDKFKSTIVQWLSVNIDIGEESLDQRYNQNLIDKLKQIKTNKELNDQLVDLLEKDADFKRQEDEKLRIEAEQEAERIRLEAEAVERETKRRLEEEEEKEKEKEKERLKKEQQEQEQLNNVEIKIESHIDEENSKDSSRFSSEDDMPLLNIVKSKGLLNETKTKSPSPMLSEKVRRSLRQAGGTKTDEAASPNHMSSASSTVSTISHKSVSLPCSSLSEEKELKQEVKPSPSNTSSVYDNLDTDENQEVYKSKKKASKKTDDEPVESSGNLVSIKQEPKDGHNISGSSLSSVSSSKTGGEEEKTHRAWKKSIMMILNNIACHKHATIFMNPVKDEIAPGYSTLIHRPIDLSKIKKNIETGTTRTTKEFQRDIMLMFTNALMYNSTNHNIHKIALEMFKEVLTDIEQLLNAQEPLCSSENMDSSVGYTLNKPLRYKDVRSSSTASDGKSSIVSSQHTLHDGQHDESVAGLLAKKGRPIKETKTSSKSSLKDESVNDAASIKSNSSVSTPRHSTTRSRVSSAAKLNQQKSPKPTAKKEEAAGKKRKPSNSSTTNLNSTLSPSTELAKNTEEDVPKSKRRKSGRYL